MFDSMEDFIYVADDFVEHFRDGKLDYSVESLNLLEEYLDDLSCFGLEDEALNNAAETIGSYIFETARRCYGGEYTWSEEYDQPMLVTVMPELSVAIMAFDKVKKRLKNESKESISLYISKYKEHIEKGKQQK